MATPGLDDFSANANAMFATAVTKYADSLENLARSYAARHELVLEDHVKDALSALGPAGKSVLLDWVKRTAFAFLGVVVTMLVRLITDPASRTGSSIVILAVVASLMLVLMSFGAVADIPWIRRQLLRR